MFFASGVAVIDAVDVAEDERRERGIPHATTSLVAVSSGRRKSIYT